MSVYAPSPCSRSASERCSGPCCSPPWSGAVAREPCRSRRSPSRRRSRATSPSIWTFATTAGRCPACTEKNFRVYEDGKLVTPKKGKRALLEPKQFDSASFMLVQVDLSGPIADSEDLPDLVERSALRRPGSGASGTRSRSARSTATTRWCRSSASARARSTTKVVEALRKFRPRSRNSNLNGAVYQGTALADEKLASTRGGAEVGDPGHLHRPRRAGAQREPRDAEGEAQGDARAGLRDRRGRGQINRDELTALGRSGTYISNNPKDFKKGFAEIGQKLTEPRRRTLRVLVLLAQAQGQPQLEIETDTPKGRGAGLAQVQRRRLHGRVARPRPSRCSKRSRR